MQGSFSYPVWVVSVLRLCLRLYHWSSFWEQGRQEEHTVQSTGEWGGASDCLTCWSRLLDDLPQEACRF